MGKKYTDYHVDDFLRDELFVQWVLGKEDQINEFWSRWMEEHPDKISIVREASLIIQSIEYKNQHSVSNSELLQLYDRIEESGGGRERSISKKPWRAYQFAAVIVLTILSGWFLLDFDNDVAEESGTLISYITKSTANGEKLTIRLPDGTNVKLNVGSSITYQDGFDGSSRSVQLSGEAIFEVVKDISRPFIVQTSQMSVTALGTSFNVDSYDEGTHSISLIEGKVSVEDKKDRLIFLEPGEMAKANSLEEIKITKVDLERITAWSKGILKLNSGDFQEVLQKLQKWYGVEIRLEGQVPEFERYEGSFDNESLEAVLKTLSYSSGFEFEINKKSVKITFN
ncbi:FecR family protein [Ekhidna sp.]